MTAEDPKQTAAADADASNAARKEEGTSAATLNDLEQTESAASVSTSADTNDSADVPTPDGTPEPTRGDTPSDAGPM